MALISSSTKIAILSLTVFIFISLLYQVNSQQSDTVISSTPPTPPAVILNPCSNINCTNGMCNSTGHCVCNEGFKKNTNEKYNCKKIICPTFRREDKMYCESSCRKNCGGLCDISGVCNCTAGFTKVVGSIYKCKAIECPSIENALYCKNTCDTSCLNGTCNNNGTCTCGFGFKKVSSLPYKCEEISCPTFDTEHMDYCNFKLCNNSCEFGTCDDKGMCSCNKGYVKNNPGNFTCSPACKNGCKLNEVCYKPDKCKCEEDFVSISPGSDCVPKCNVSLNCWNGICLKDAGKCSCKIGYKLIASNQCMPTCSNKCNNGVCILPDMCLCNEGYVKRNGECLKENNTALVIAAITLFLVLLYATGRTGWFLARRYYFKMKSKDHFPASMSYVNSDDGRPPCPLPRPEEGRDTPYRKDSSEPQAEYLDLFAENKQREQDAAKRFLPKSSDHHDYENVDTSRATPPLNRLESVEYQNFAFAGPSRSGGTTNQNSQARNLGNDKDLDDDGYLLPSALEAYRKK